MQCVDKLKSLPFVNQVKEAGGKIYAVGGVVRDELMGKQSKDLDILITGVPETKLVEILENHGRVDQVGKSFGIIKFKVEGGEEIDIALPRTEKKREEEEGHHAFDVVVDHTLTIEQDLARRDFTFNAIAVDEEGNIIDPYEGVKAIADKKLITVTPTSYTDDPLRILRAVQFSARFGFYIGTTQFNLIKESLDKLKYVSKERIIIELKKACIGDDMVSNRLIDLLFYEMDPRDENSTIIYKCYEDIMKEHNLFSYPHMLGAIQNISHLMAIITNSWVRDEELVEFLTNMKLSREDITLAKGLNSLMLGNINDVFPVISKLPEILTEAHKGGYKFSKPITKTLKYMYIGEVPKSLKELAVNGNDFIRWGFKGPQLGNAYKKAITAIVKREIENDAKEIEDYVLHDLK